MVQAEKEIKNKIHQLLQDSGSDYRAILKLTKELSKLEQEGIFISQFRGKQKYFFLNKTYSLFNELNSIILKGDEL